MHGMEGTTKHINLSEYPVLGFLFSLILILILTGCNSRVHIHPNEYDLFNEVCKINNGWDYTYRKLTNNPSVSYYYEIFCNDGARFIRTVKTSDMDGRNDS